MRITAHLPCALTANQYKLHTTHTMNALGHVLVGNCNTCDNLICSPGQALLTTYSILHTTYFTLHTTYYILHTTYYILHTIYYTTYYLLLTTYYLLLTTYLICSPGKLRAGACDATTKGLSCATCSYYILQTTDYILHTTYHIPLSTYYSLDQLRAGVCDATTNGLSCATCSHGKYSPISSGLDTCEDCRVCESGRWKGSPAR